MIHHLKQCFYFVVILDFKDFLILKIIIFLNTNQASKHFKEAGTHAVAFSVYEFWG